MNTPHTWNLPDVFEGLPEFKGRFQLPFFISMRRELNLASGGSLNLTLLCVPMYMLEIQEENTFSEDFLNNFKEVIFKIFYL